MGVYEIPITPPTKLKELVTRVVRLLKLLTALEGPTDIDESDHRDWLAIKNPCRATADANAEVSF